MDDHGEQLLAAIDHLDEVAGGLTPEQAAEALDEATLQTFWREWPRASAWAGALWRALNRELEQPAATADDPEVDEIGGSG